MDWNRPGAGQYGPEEDPMLRLEAFSAYGPMADRAGQHGQGTH